MCVVIGELTILRQQAVKFYLNCSPFCRLVSSHLVLFAILPLGIQTHNPTLRYQYHPIYLKGFCGHSICQNISTNGWLLVSVEGGIF